MFMKHYPEQAESIDWVYDEVAKVHSAEYSSDDGLSTAVSSLLLKPVEHARVYANSEAQNGEISNALVVSPLHPGPQKLTFRLHSDSAKFYKALCV